MTEKEFDEDELEEEEEEKEEPEDSNFNIESFIPAVGEAESFSPVLESGEVHEIPDNLEQGVENAPSEQRAEETRVYNMPDYGRDYEILRQEREGERDREINIISGNLGRASADNVGKINLAQWQRGMQEPTARARERDYETYQLKRAEQSEGLPFEEKKQKRRVF